jgi:hypothetical protein
LRIAIGVDSMIGWPVRCWCGARVCLHSLGCVELR